MGFADKFKDAVGQARAKAAEAADKHGDKINDGIEKAARTANEKTGGKYADKIAKGSAKAKEGLARLDAEHDANQRSAGEPGGDAGRGTGGRHAADAPVTEEAAGAGGGAVDDRPEQVSDPADQRDDRPGDQPGAR